MRPLERETGSERRLGGRAGAAEGPRERMWDRRMRPRPPGVAASVTPATNATVTMVPMRQRRRSPATRIQLELPAHPDGEATR